MRRLQEMTSCRLLMHCLVLSLLGRVSAFTDSVIYDQPSCEDIVPGCNPCEACAISCWQNQFLRCNCIPRVLKDVVYREETLDASFICMWSVANEGGLPDCCLNFMRRTFDLANLDNSTEASGSRPNQNEAEAISLKRGQVKDDSKVGTGKSRTLSALISQSSYSAEEEPRPCQSGQSP